MNKLTVSLYDDLGDFTGSLRELKRRVDELIPIYGPEAIVEFNAGYNNIDCNVIYDPNTMLCGVNKFSSCVCVLGTKGCIVEAHNPVKE